MRKAPFSKEIGPALSGLVLTMVGLMFIAGPLWDGIGTLDTMSAPDVLKKVLDLTVLGGASMFFGGIYLALKPVK